MTKLESKQEEVDNLASCMLSILDSLNLHECKDNDEEWNNESLSEMMFRKMKGYNVDLNELLGFTHLKSKPKK